MLLRRPTPCDNLAMTLTSLPQPHEQRKIERLLVKLSKAKPISAKPAAMVQGPKVFFST